MRRRLDSRIAALMIVVGSLVTSGAWSDAWGQGRSGRDDDGGELGLWTLCNKMLTEKEKEGGVTFDKNDQISSGVDTLVCVKTGRYFEGQVESRFKDDVFKLVLSWDAGKGLRERTGWGNKKDTLFTAVLGNDSLREGILKGDRAWEERSVQQGTFRPVEEKYDGVASCDSNSERVVAQLAKNDAGEIQGLVKLGQFKGESRFKEKRYAPTLNPFASGFQHKGFWVELDYEVAPVRVDGGLQAGGVVALHTNVERFTLRASSLSSDGQHYTAGSHITCEVEPQHVNAFICSKGIASGEKCEISFRDATTVIDDDSRPAPQGGVPLCELRDIFAEMIDGFDESPSSRVHVNQARNLLMCDAYREGDLDSINVGLIDEGLPIDHDLRGRLVVTSRAIPHLARSILQTLANPQSPTAMGEQTVEVAYTPES